MRSSPVLTLPEGMEIDFGGFGKEYAADRAAGVLIEKGIRHAIVNLLANTVWSLAHQQATGERDSSTLLATVALGGDYARVRTDARVVGQGATTRQVALLAENRLTLAAYRGQAICKVTGL